MQEQQQEQDCEVCVDKIEEFKYILMGGIKIMQVRCPEKKWQFLNLN